MPLVKSVFIVANVFVPLLVVFVFGLFNACPLLFAEMFSLRFEATGREAVDVSEVTVVVLIVEREEAKAGAIRPCRRKSL